MASDATSFTEVFALMALHCARTLVSKSTWVMNDGVL